MKKHPNTPETNAFEMEEGFIDDWGDFARKLELSRDFYKTRCEELQKAQRTMRDPERKMACDILANGFMQNVTNEFRCS